MRREALIEGFVSQADRDLLKKTTVKKMKGKPASKSARVTFQVL